jgi:hypothetical protein
MLVKEHYSFASNEDDLNIQKQLDILNKLNEKKMELKQLKDLGDRMSNISSILDKIKGNDCTLCYSKRQKFIMFPCYHKCLCEDCKINVECSDKKCPICKAQISLFLDADAIKYA